MCERQRQGNLRLISKSEDGLSDPEKIYLMYSGSYIIYVRQRRLISDFNAVQVTFFFKSIYIDHCQGFLHLMASCYSTIDHLSAVTIYKQSALFQYSPDRNIVCSSILDILYLLNVRYMDPLQGSSTCNSSWLLSNRSSVKYKPSIDNEHSSNIGTNRKIVNFIY